MDAHIKDGKVDPQPQHHDQIDVDNCHQDQRQVVGRADPGPAEPLGKGQEQQGQYSSVKDVAAQNVANHQFRLSQEQGGRDAGEQFRQRGDGGQNHTADEGTGNAGALIDDIHIVGEQDGKSHYNSCKNQVFYNDHK